VIKERSNDSLQCLAEQTSQLYTATNYAVLATLVNALLLIIVLWPVVDNGYLLLWLTVMILVCFGRYFTAYQFKQLEIPSDKFIIWFQRYIVGSTSSALVWVAAIVFLFPIDDFVRQVFLAFVIGAISVGAMTSMAFSKLAIFSFISLIFITLSARFYFSDSELGFNMSYMLMFYYSMLLLVANRTYNNLIKTILLKINSIERERSLQQSEHRYEKIIETASDAFFLHSLNGNFIDVNKLACNSLGYIRDELLHLNVTDIVIDHDVEKLIQLWPKLELGENIQMEGIHKRKDGTTFPVEVRICMIKMNDETMLSVLARDVTERIHSDELKNEFIHTVSHVLRTPLSAISKALHSINDTSLSQLPEKVSNIITETSNDADRTMLLINDILDIQNIESGTMEFLFESVEVKSFIEQAVDNTFDFAEQYQINFKIKNTIPEAKIYVDKKRLMQVISNLLTNAAKFSNKSELVDINIFRIDKDYLRISITDFGLGIPKEFQHTIFDKFSLSRSTNDCKKNSTGLGLNLTKLIIENLNGKINFISGKDVGTTFNIDLPELKS